MRRKATKNEAKILDKLAERYESPKEAKKRVNDLLDYFDRMNIGTKWELDKFKDLTAIPIKELKVALGKKKTSDLVKSLCENLYDDKLDYVDLELNKDTTLRIMRRGVHTEVVFAKFKKGGKKWVIRTPNEIYPYVSSDKQKVLLKIKGFQREEYCGINLEALSYIVENSEEEKFLKKLEKKLSKRGHFTQNVTYNTETKELISVDKQ